MQPTKVRTLLIAGLVGGVLGWSFYRVWESAGQKLPGLPIYAIIGMVVLGIILLAAGWPIRRWVRGDRDRPLDPLRAARVLVLAKAASAAGSVLTGWYVGTAVYFFTFASNPARVNTGLETLFVVGAALFLVVVGLVVEYFCRLPPDDEDEGKHSA
ncbi:DUF3180 domain-containing protein [Spelaeicoccus albus]|uniref:DUF3180 family protein n=1 Tax=Spelaeicoccus albus TaxID=1280376 RepID=A0A7Z0D5Y1_9MICO|nr:DUF3180 domain-containing protein [Spelaeicoccus albus]NYI69429.1 hypothetical protein [Spelaeicoccus albus]